MLTVDNGKWYDISGVIGVELCDEVDDDDDEFDDKFNAVTVDGNDNGVSVVWEIVLLDCVLLGIERCCVTFTDWDWVYWGEKIYFY